MDLEFHQLELRYEALRLRLPERERRLLSSLADNGQQTPVVVVPASGSAGYVLVDGYRRVRCLRRLQRDTVCAVAWEMTETEALIFRQVVHAEAVSALEQAWLLRTLHEEHEVGMEELARRFDRSVSWVSRRLSLLRELPEPVQQRVREGGIVPHAAMKYLVPLARANEADCLRLVEAIKPRLLTTRQMGQLYQAYMRGNEKARELVVSEPLLVLRVEDETRRKGAEIAPSPVEALISDLHAIGGLVRRASSRLRRGVALLPPDKEQAWRAFRQAQLDFAELQHRCEKELNDARPCHTNGDPGTEEPGLRRPPDRTDAAHLPRGGAQGARRGHAGGAADRAAP
jgi:ParB/RepB/Spo0J family partition protein